MNLRESLLKSKFNFFIYQIGLKFLIKILQNFKLIYQSLVLCNFINSVL